MKIGEQIKFWRKKRGISQVELAKIVGVSRSSTIYDIESGRRKTTQNMLEKISEALDCKLKMEDNDK